VTATGHTIESYRFSHTLFRDVLYGALGVSQRAELHLRTGEMLEGLSPGGEVPAAQLAHHFRIAAGGSASSKAARYAMEAGHQALRSFAFTDAARYFDGALEALRLGAGQEPLILETLTSLGHAHRPGEHAGGTAFGRA
jgi:predicted ATPase